MKYFITVLGLLTSFNLSAMNSGEPAHGVDQNTQQARPVLRLYITPYKDLSDAMKSEEYLACNMSTLITNYLCVVNARNAERATPDDIIVTREYDIITDLWWRYIEDEVSRISSSRRSIRFLLNMQVNMVQTLHSFRLQLYHNNLNAASATELVPAIACNAPQAYGSVLRSNMVAYNNLSDAMLSEGYLAGNLQTMVNNYLYGVSTRNTSRVNQEDIIIINECDMVIDNWWGYVCSAINHISATRQSIRCLIDMQRNQAPVPEYFQRQNVTNAQNQQQVNVQNQFTRPATQAQSAAMQMPSNLRHN